MVTKNARAPRQAVGASELSSTTGNADNIATVLNNGTTPQPAPTTLKNQLIDALMALDNDIPGLGKAVGLELFDDHPWLREA